MLAVRPRTVVCMTVQALDRKLCGGYKPFVTHQIGQHHYRDDLSSGQDRMGEPFLVLKEYQSYDSEL